jgi:hypothetical protein
MSQSGFFINGNPGMGFLQTLTGNDGLIVVPDGAQNIDVLGDDIFTTTSRTGASELTISLINTSFISVTTIDATPTTLFSLAIPINSAVSIYCDVLGAQDTFALVCSGFIQCSARRQGGGAAIVGIAADLSSSNNFATAEFDIVVVGNNIVLQVTGEVATTINWVATVRYLDIP